jgi:peroxiredoxin
MYFMKRMGWCFFLTLFIFAFCGEKAVDKPSAETPREKPAALFQSESQVIDQVKKLKDEGKTDEAFALLDRGLKQYPMSMKLLKRKYSLLRGSKRYEECLLMLNEALSKVPAEAREDVLAGKRKILMHLAQVALKKNDIQAAMQRLEEMANAGYRGFYDIIHDELFKPLHSMPGFNDIMKKIEENTGIGQPAKDLTVTLTNGETFRLSDQKGKVVLVDFWSTHCPPCIEEFPNLRACYKAFKHMGFEILSISLDNKKEELEALLAKQPMPWKTVFSGKGWVDDAALLYRVHWIPSLWLVDREGILRYFDVRGEDLKAAITQLVNK